MSSSWELTVLLQTLLPTITWRLDHCYLLIMKSIYCTTVSSGLLRLPIWSFLGRCFRVGWLFMFMNLATSSWSKTVRRGTRWIFCRQLLSEQRTLYNRTWNSCIQRFQIGPRSSLSVVGRLHYSVCGCQCQRVRVVPLPTELLLTRRKLERAGVMDWPEGIFPNIVMNSSTTYTCNTTSLSRHISGIDSPSIADCWRVFVQTPAVVVAISVLSMWST